MARDELIMKLQDQIAELDMALMTATGSEIEMLETIRKGLESQLDAMTQARSSRQLRAA